MNLGNHIAMGLLMALVVSAYRQHVPVLQTFVSGVKEGLLTAWGLVPYFLLMLVAIAMLRASGLLTDFAHWLAPTLQKLGFPAEVLPLALIRPFSASGANAMLFDIIHQHGADSYFALVAGSIIGSTETTFYVLTVYFGAVNIQRTRYAIPVGLFADLCGVLAAVWICKFYF